MFAARWPTPLASVARQCAAARVVLPKAPHTAHRAMMRQQGICTATRTETSHAASFLRSYRLALAASLPLVAVGLGASRQQPIRCASDTRAYAQTTSAQTGALGAYDEPLPAESIINLRDLSFGTVSGICVGIFVKKGLKACGVFVFLQYMSSRSLLQINWGAITNSYDSFIAKRAGPPASAGGNRITGLWSWFVDFVSADVQSRATFIAGILLGFRLG
ncbi:BQ5605_C007g04592 [Microbotryum silenes-dioicae]|uniref:BQ5605_C007g04592 protein n=1 Tax=Microbotryum silenes-dioicae TaxID=796604 RepID=A0A2X0P9U1_9BASI|nr:BQ5605_C007g04592 [Microbotryum silenes-dioicae]